MKARGKRVAKRSASPLVNVSKLRRALKGRNTAALFRPFRPCPRMRNIPRGDALRFAMRLPLAFIFRAFGAFLVGIKAKLPAPQNLLAAVRNQPCPVDLPQPHASEDRRRALHLCFARPRALTAHTYLQSQRAGSPDREKQTPACDSF